MITGDKMLEINGIQKNLNLFNDVFDKNQWPIIYPLSIKKNVKIIGTYLY